MADHRDRVTDYTRWTAEQQAALDVALREDASAAASSGAVSASARWKSIAAKVPDRGARECLARFREIRAAAAAALLREVELREIRTRYAESYASVECAAGDSAFSLLFVPLVDSRRLVGALRIFVTLPSMYPTSSAVYRVEAEATPDGVEGDPLQARCAARALQLFAARGAGNAKCTVRADLKWLDNHFEEVASVAEELRSRETALKGGIQRAVVAVEEGGGGSDAPQIESHAEWVEYAGAVAHAKVAGQPGGEGLWTLEEQLRLEAALMKSEEEGCGGKGCKGGGFALDWARIGADVVTRDAEQCRARYVELHELLKLADAPPPVRRGRRRGRRKKGAGEEAGAGAGAGAGAEAEAGAGAEKGKGKGKGRGRRKKKSAGARARAGAGAAKAPSGGGAAATSTST